MDTKFLHSQGAGMVMLRDDALLWKDSKISWPTLFVEDATSGRAQVFLVPGNPFGSLKGAAVGV